VIIRDENYGRVNKFLKGQVSTIKQKEESVPGPSYIIIWLFNSSLRL
jgi:hypothetical protein